MKAKQVFTNLYWLVFITISLWIIMSFVDVNYTNVTNAELAPWNLFEIIYQLSEEAL